jgi:tetratricopeptide (TPR) repeat protein
MSQISLLERVRSRLRQVLHCWLGGYHLRRGELTRAQEHFLRALDHDALSFRAHLSLGRIYLRQDRIPRAVEELQCAREIDPHRFAREGFPGDPLLWMAERLPETRLQRNVAVNGPGPGGIPAPDGEAMNLYEDGSDVDELPFGDFTGRDEAERFSLLPPIALSDVEDIDWDALGRELIEGE